jgi:hypothetical protein
MLSLSLYGVSNQNEFALLESFQERLVNENVSMIYGANESLRMNNPY